MSSHQSTGQALLVKFGSTLRRITALAVLNRYGMVPDAEDRVAEGLAALVDAAHTFKPLPGREGIVAFTRYALAQVAGQTRNGAERVKEWSDEVSFTDLFRDEDTTDSFLDEIGVSGLDVPAVLGGEATWTVNNGQALSTTRLIQVLLDEHKERVAKLLGIELEEVRGVTILRVLDALAEQGLQEPTWLLDKPGAEDAVSHDLEPITVKRTLPSGEVRVEVIKGERAAEMVNRASLGQTAWVEDQFPQQYEEDWPSWAAGDASRQRDGDPAQDNLTPEEVIPLHLWRKVVKVWQERISTRNVQDAIAGNKVYLTGEERGVVEAMRTLGDHLEGLGVDDPCLRRALLALAEDIISKGRGSWWKPSGGTSPTGAMYTVLLHTLPLSIDFGGGWDPPSLPSINVLRRKTKGWLAKLYQASWRSEAMATRALVEGGSPYEARIAYKTGLEAGRGLRGL